VIDDGRTSRQEFVEFFVRGVLGTITVDLGTVDEDRMRRNDDGVPVGVGTLDTEETDPDTRDNSLDVGEDTGLDGVSGTDPLEVPGDDGNDDFDERVAADNFPQRTDAHRTTTRWTPRTTFSRVLDRQEDALRWNWISLIRATKCRAAGTAHRLPDPASARTPTRSWEPDLRNVRAIGSRSPGWIVRSVRARAAGDRGARSSNGASWRQTTPLAGRTSDSLQIASDQRHRESGVR
jgi:hypothetical protein